MKSLCENTVPVNGRPRRLRGLAAPAGCRRPKARRSLLRAGRLPGVRRVELSMAEADAKATVAALKAAALIKSKKADWRLVAAA